MQLAEGHAAKCRRIERPRHCAPAERRQRPRAGAWTWPVACIANVLIV
jgi:hypothetical protein